ncbi:hypothetical protein UFOVP273_95 [uncultured Caudovirales phage]|uniref:Uncharacterized protein n=1 Tax=uncultured Caudovirales phage TaxID=2100421 RepID=A0A6J5LNJ2_9CAUD|nr:hypothetical protein UFOVP273_95 [uncultured Caudovirales phage]
MLKRIKKIVLDVQDFPDEVRDAFFAYTQQGNDCYVDWCLDDYCAAAEVGKESEFLEEYDDKDFAVVCKFLYDNGVRDNCIIKHWW